jgi:hypothetical protein
MHAALSCAQSMSDFEPDGGSEGPWDEQGDLAWTEFDWERYLRGQDEAVSRYLRHYEAARGQPDRIDVAAEKMGWGGEGWTEDENRAAAEESASATADDDVYTLHKNPVYISTKAIYASLEHSWMILAANPARVSPPATLRLLQTFHRGAGQATEAVHALDFGDYAMAVSLFKRALGALNDSLSTLGDDDTCRHPSARVWSEEARARLFDLREIWLRVMTECRDELERPDEEDDEEQN